MRFGFRSRRRSLFLVSALTGVSLLGASALWSHSQTQDSDTTREIAPGLTLRSVQTQTPQGPLRYWLVQAGPDKFDLGLQIADTADAQKKRNVRTLSAQSKAIVAVNGGFFAYGGAAVGAVKANGSWQRLPWKSRTSLAWNTAQDAQIGPLSGSCTLVVESSDGKIQRQSAALNGFALPGERSEVVNGYAVLTPQFARKYTLKAGEIAVSAPGGTATAFQPNVTLPAIPQVVAPVQPALPPGAPILAPAPITAPLNPNDVDLQSASFVVIARGEAAKSLDPQNPPRLLYFIRTTPPTMDRFQNILGAGPRLVEQGQVKTTEVEEEFRPDVVARGPRTAVGLDAQHNWMLLVADGRSASSVGLTIPETAQLFGQLGAVEAMNLDGGSSTQLVVNGELVNVPSGFDPVNPTRPREVQVSNGLTLKARTQD